MRMHRAEREKRRSWLLLAIWMQKLAAQRPRVFSQGVAGESEQEGEDSFVPPTDGQEPCFVRDLHARRSGDSSFLFFFFSLRAKEEITQTLRLRRSTPYDLPWGPCRRSSVLSPALAAPRRTAPYLSLHVKSMHTYKVSWVAIFSTRIVMSLYKTNQMCIYR